MAMNSSSGADIGHCDSGRTLGEVAKKGGIRIGVNAGAECPECGRKTVFQDIVTHLHWCDQCGWEGWFNGDAPRKKKVR